MRGAVLSGIVVLVAAGAASAATHTVPSDATPTIQSAVDAAKPGDAIVVLAGTYPESVSIAGRSRLRILGRGGPVIAPEGGNGLDIDGCEDLLISGIRVQGAGNGLWAYDTSGLVLKGVVLQGVSYEAFGLRNCDGVLLSRCQALEVGGIGLDEEGSTGLVVDRCVFQGCAGGGLSLSPEAAAGSASEGARVTRTLVWEAPYGIRAGGAGLVLDRNRFKEVHGAALDLDTAAGGEGALVSRNNVVVASTDTAVHLKGDDLRCRGNRVVGGGIRGQGDRILIERNLVSAADYGIALGGNDGAVLGNVVAAVAGNGLEADGTGHRVERNRVGACGNAGIHSSMTGGRILRNRVADATWGFLIVRGGNAVSGNLVRGETTLDLWDQQMEGPNEYGRNAFRTTKFGE